ncbi:MAG: hypothetical protein QOJ60_6 [Actinomycetota bacterium]|nr:hypothetical protein [Actinomycetota bacterium]
MAQERDVSPAGPAGTRPEPDLSALLGALRIACETSPALVAVSWGPENLLVYQNAASVRLVGPRPLGVPLGRAVPELGDRAFPELDEVRRTGRVFEFSQRVVDVPDVYGGELLLDYVLSPLGDGPPYDGVVMTAVDVTATARAQRAVFEGELLGGLSRLMATADSPDAALHALTEALVPVVADIAAVFVAPPGQSAAQSGASPVAMSISAALLDHVGPPPPPEPRDGPSPWDSALAAGELVLIDLQDARRDSGTSSSAADWLERAETRNLAVIPLTTGGDYSGAVVLMAAGAREPFGPEHTVLLTDIASRAGTAVAQHRTAAQQQELALQLQRSLLPAAPPEIPGLLVAARYVAGNVEVGVGGDWWDVHHLGAGRVGVGVGDVSGRGVPAAMVMGQARAGMRAAAHADLSPVDILTVLDAQVTELVRIDDSEGHRLPPRFATAAYAVIDPFDETLRVASAGHPPMLVRYPSGVVEEVAAPPGPPLGLGVAQYEDIVVPFPAGSVLVAYTDGLVESRTRDLETGIGDLAKALAETSDTHSLEAVADALLALAEGSDDTALALIEYAPPERDAARLQRRIDDLAAVSDTRHALEEMVAEIVPALRPAAGAVAAELLANAILHAGPPAQMRAMVTGRRVLLEVSDTSALRPQQRVASQIDEHGRGLPIVAAFAHTWGFRITRDGKSTWAEILLGDD